MFVGVEVVLYVHYSNSTPLDMVWFRSFLARLNNIRVTDLDGFWQVLVDLLGLDLAMFGGFNIFHHLTWLNFYTSRHQSHTLKAPASVIWLLGDVRYSGVEVTPVNYTVFCMFMLWSETARICSRSTLLEYKYKVLYTCEVENHQIPNFQLGKYLKKYLRPNLANGFSTFCTVLVVFLLH